MIYVAQKMAQTTIKDRIIFIFYGCVYMRASVVVSGDALCWRVVVVVGGCFQGFHFEAKMDACAHFFLMPLWPYLAPYIILMNAGTARPAV